MKALVTGAAGFIGHHLIEALLPNYECIGVDSERSGAWSRVASGVARVERDLCEISFEEWLVLLQGVDVLFHLAAEKYNSSSMTPERVLAVNVTATDVLFRAAVKAGVRRIVFTSSLYAYGSYGPGVMRESDLPYPNTHYGISKLAGEHLLRANCHNSSTEWNVARLFFIYGPGQFSEGGYKSVIVKSFEKELVGDAMQICGTGTQSLDYVYVDDCVSALIKLAESESSSNIVNVATEKTTTIELLISKMQTISGSTTPAMNVPADATEGTSRWGSNEQIRKKFDWVPLVTIDDGLAKTWSWFQNSIGERKANA